MRDKEIEEEKRRKKSLERKSGVLLRMMCIIFVIISWSVMVNNGKKVVLEPAIINDAFSSVSAWG